MRIDDPLEVMLRQLEEDTPDLQDNMIAAMIDTLLSMFPVGGPAIKSLIAGKAKRNINRRIKELFREMKTRLEEIKDSIPDENYYASEEFQTLLALSIEQLQTTHDEAKRKMLANALANSGSNEFRSDDKEQYIRIVRDLSPTDLSTLHELASLYERGSDHGILGYTLTGGKTSPSLARLTALGLVDETFKAALPPPHTYGTNDSYAARAWAEMATRPPNRDYQISEPGRRFIQFLSGSSQTDNFDIAQKASESGPDTNTSDGKSHDESAARIPVPQK